MSVQGQLWEQVRNTRRGRMNSWTALPFLNFRVSESLDFLASFLGTLLMAGLYSHTGVLWVSNQKVGTCFPQKLLQRKGKTLAATWCTGSSNGETPSPVCTLLSASTCFMGSRKHLRGRGGCRGRILCRWGWGWEGKQQSPFSHPGMIYCGLPTLQTHFSTLVNNHPFIQPVWNHQSLIIDLRPGFKVGKVWVFGEWEEAGVEPIKSRVGVGRMA